MTFRIYNVATDGTHLWEETQSVTVTNGVFNVVLGSLVPLDSTVFGNDSLFLAVQVGADDEMTPRQRISSSAFAHRAETLTDPIHVPVGAIVAWNKSMPGTPALDSHWVECNGQVISDPESPYDGLTVPDLNGVEGPQRFLRGSETSGVEGGTEDHSHAMDRQAWTGSGGQLLWHRTNSQTGRTNNLPSYFEVVWIMRIK
ncbi:MAG: hypothetical protein GY835_28390 [bacterium]|nr:hypothetical protein [bacterium]